MHYEVIDQDDIGKTTIEEYYSRNLDTVDNPSEKTEFRTCRYYRSTMRSVPNTCR